MSIVGQNEYQDVDGDGIWDEIDWPAEGDFPARRAFARPKTETTIDGRNLTINNGTIRVGMFPGQQEADNTVSNLTILGGKPATGTGGAEIRVQGLPLGSAVQVTDCLLQGGQRGIMLSPRLSNTSAYLLAERNILRDHDLTPSSLNTARGWGIHLAVEGSLGVKLSNVKNMAEVRYNRFYNNRIGLFVSHLETDDCENVVISHSNIYEEQTDVPSGFEGVGRGLFSTITNGRDSRNQITSTHDTIWNNVGSGGVVAQFSVSSGDEIRDCIMDVSLLQTRFVRVNAAGELDGLQNRTEVGKRADITIVDLSPGDTADSNINGNRTQLLLRGAVSSLVPTALDPAPTPFIVVDRPDVSPAQVEISITGSPNAFVQTNTGLNLALDPSLFTTDGSPEDEE